MFDRRSALTITKNDGKHFPALVSIFSPKASKNDRQATLVFPLSVQVLIASSTDDNTTDLSAIAV